MATLPLGDIDDNDMRRMERELLRVMARHVPTFPDTTTSQGVLGNFSFNSDLTKIAIHTGTSWKTIALTDSV